MTAVVLDASAVLALVCDEPGGDKVAPYVGRAAISAVNLREVVGELLLSGLPEPVIRSRVNSSTSASLFVLIIKRSERLSAS